MIKWASAVSARRRNALAGSGSRFRALGDDGGGTLHRSGGRAAACRARRSVASPFFFDGHALTGSDDEGIAGCVAAGALRCHTELASGQAGGVALR